MPVISLVPSDSPTLISSPLSLSAHHLALAALASQRLKSGTLSLYLSVPVPVLTPSVVISRPTTASRPSTPLNPSPLAPHIRLCWPLCAFINYIYLLTYTQRPRRTQTLPCIKLRTLVSRYVSNCRWRRSSADVAGISHRSENVCVCTSLICSGGHQPRRQPPSAYFVITVITLISL